MNEHRSKVFVFHGCDYKVGTTMTAQAVAELVSEYRKDLRVLFLCLNGRESTSYCCERINSIEAIKMKVDNRLLTHEELMRTCIREKQMFVMGGANGILSHRHFSPEFPAYIIDMAVQIFDLIIVDSGNEIDCGLAVGSLKLTENCIMVMAQNETILTRFEALKPIYSALNITFSRFVVNRYLSEDPHDIKYLRKRLQLTDDNALFLIHDQHSFSRFAEMDKTTLLEYKSQDYLNGISEIAMYMFEKAGIEGSIDCKGKKKLPFGKW